MNLLIDTPPTSINIDGLDYEINYGFKSCLRTVLAFEDPELTTQEKQLVLLTNMYITVPENIQEAVIQAMKFLDGGKDRDLTESVEPAYRLYSMSKDSGLIYSAFKQTHAVDLLIEDLHWWVFMSLFMDLRQDSTFCSLVGLRSRLHNGTATKEERIAASKMGELVSVEQLDSRTVEEKELEEAFIAAVERAEIERNKRKEGI